MTFDLENEWADDFQIFERGTRSGLIEIETAKKWHAAYRKAQNSNLLRKQEIKRLRAENAGLSKTVIDVSQERDLAQAEFRVYHKAWEQQTDRIEELDGMIDARSKEIVGRIQECLACQIDLLRAEGKIGSGDHVGEPDKLIGPEDAT